MATHTRMHVYVTFANPFLVCDECGIGVERWHNEQACGCHGGYSLSPCGHVGVTSLCPSWSPVDGCRCAEHLGIVEHEPERQAA